MRSLNIDDYCDIYSIKPNEKNENHLEIITTKQSKFYKTGFARLSPFLISQSRYHMSKFIHAHKENIEQLRVSDKVLGIKTGDKIGDLQNEGTCDNCIINFLLQIKFESPSSPSSPENPLAPFLPGAPTQPG